MNIIKIIKDILINLYNFVLTIEFFFRKIIISIFTKKLYYSNISYHLFEIGFLSIPIIGISCLFSGAVLVLQTYTSFTLFANESSIAAIVAISVTRELSPVMSSLMVSGRVGGAMASEISTMKVSEQIDALKTLKVNPIQYLVVPRIIANLISMPMLIIIGNILGILGGYLVSIYSLEFNSHYYLLETVEHIKLENIKVGLIKSLCFGFLISFISCYCGYHSDKGAIGVGKSTTNAVLYSCLFILLSNYFITAIMF